MPKHKDSVSYWKQVTATDSGLGRSHRAPQEGVLSYFIDRFSIRSDDYVLDVGTGYGRLIPLLSAYSENLFAVDYDAEMVRSAQDQHASVCQEIRKADASNLPYDNEKFDKLICWAVFDELSQMSCVQEFNRVLKYGGQLLITGKNDFYLKEDEEAFNAECGARNKDHPNEFTNFDPDLFKLFGFSIVDSWFYLKRNDFSENDYVKSKPDRFYEYALILQKDSDISFSEDLFPVLSRPYSRTWLEKKLDTDLYPKHPSIAGEKAIFLSGVYRSGTTILAQMIGAHPDIYLTYDSVKYLRFSLSPERYPENTTKVLEDISARITGRWEMTFNAKEVESSLVSPASHASIYLETLKQLRDNYKPGARYVGEKNAVVWSQIPFFLDMFPDGKVVHIFRDPRDVVASYKNMTYEPGYAYLDAVFNFIHAWESVADLQKYYGRDRVFSLRLEDLLSEPETQLLKLCDFLGIDYSSDMLDQKQYRDKKGSLWRHNSAFESSESKLNRDSSRWQEHLTQEEILFVELIGNRQMIEAGYNPSEVSISDDEWNKISNILKDELIHKRFVRWLTTAKGVEGYPSDPKIKELTSITKK